MLSGGGPHAELDQLVALHVASLPPIWPAS